MEDIVLLILDARFYVAMTDTSFAMTAVES